MAGSIDSSHSCLKAAYDVGIDFSDCAEGCAGGESERMIGRVIEKFGWKRNDIIVSTKLRTSLIKSTWAVMNTHCYDGKFWARIIPEEGKLLQDTEQRAKTCLS